MLLRQQRGRRSQPVPVPNLTKKSRGRKVPVSREEVETPLDSAKLSGERRYVCTVDGCGKCFVRGEHLKRHVRSLHTWEKREWSFALDFLWVKG
ncbi:hypothetical protein L218DRAFT_863906 [Marasmius fiardii PR-910]|nr:hypothetical protein L218DRAFT_863906 [Marasmius fiardii PR-910]